jgi:signal transduction histidine kinase
MSNIDNSNIVILTIEDDEVVRVSIKNYLEDCGYQVHEAADGQQGLDAFMKLNPDLVLIDLRMPVVDGLEVLDTIAKKSPDTPAIIVSGTGVIGEVIQSLKNGAWDFLQKPIVDLENLSLAVTSALERAKTIKENRIYKATLEAKVRERTAELKGVNENLAAFNYSISNALHVPLRHIEGFGGLLADELGEEISEPAKKYLGTVLSGVADAKNLMKKLLQFSRSTHEEIVFLKTDLSVKARSIAASLSRDKTNSQISYIVGDVKEIKTDLTLISLVLENLLTNASYYCKEVENPTVEFNSEMQENEVVYFVRDNGTGFDSSRKDKIFVPFHSFHTDARFEGVGLGLATSKKIVERLGGRIWAESEEGKGATLYFTLPSKS